MQSSEVINDILQKSVIDGKKIPHSTSYPVLVNENGRKSRTEKELFL